MKIMENVVYKRTHKGYAIQAIEDGDLETFRDIVPAYVSPDELSDGGTTQRRSIRAIAEYWASRSGNQDIVNYIRNLAPVAPPA